MILYLRGLGIFPRDFQFKKMIQFRGILPCSHEKLLENGTI